MNVGKTILNHWEWCIPTYKIGDLGDGLLFYHVLPTWLRRFPLAPTLGLNLFTGVVHQPSGQSLFSERVYSASKYRGCHVTHN